MNLRNFKASINRGVDLDDVALATKNGHKFPKIGGHRGES
jgi:hypothetical protein